MNVVWIDAAGRRDLALRPAPDATVADVARALGAAGDAVADAEVVLVVDGIAARGDLSLAEAGLHEGAELGPAGTAPGPPAPTGGLVELCVLAGLDAGRRLPLAPGAYRLGRSASCEIVVPLATVSRLQCRLDVHPTGQVEITSLSPGTTIYVDGAPLVDTVAVAPDAVVEAGRFAFAVRPPAPADRPKGIDRFRDVGPGGTISLNRPPRFAPASDPLAVDLPKAPEKANKAPFSIASVVAPLVIGAVMVVALHSLFYAMFALLSPVMVLGNWWETKHRSTRTFRSDTRTYREGLRRLESRLVEAAAAERARRRVVTPDVAEVLRRASEPSVQLWERRPVHDDFLRVLAGVGDVSWAPAVVGRQSGPPASEVAEVLGRHGQLRATPVALDLSGGGVVGVVGPRSAALALARSVVLQAAIHQGPADVRMAFVVDGSHAADWDWAKWLPHTRDPRPGSGGRRFLACGEDEVNRLLSGLLADAPAQQPGAPPAPLGAQARGDQQHPTTLYLVDGDALLVGRNSRTRAVLRGGAGPAAGVVVSESADRLPAMCTAVVHLDEWGGMELREPQLGHGATAATATGLDAAPAVRGALALARFDDPELSVPGAGLPERVSLQAVAGLDALDAASVSRRWRSSDGGFHLRAPIGVSEAGVFVLDWDLHGPHGLVGGTTGSGKSELLKSLVAAFALSYPPDELTFGLFDFKGGSTFTAFASLPHTVGMANDLDVNLARRALTCLRAELVHRERAFDLAGAKDLADYRERRRRPGADGQPVVPIPRLIVIIDEFAAMAAELNDEIAALTDLTARGRSLGVHLLLATQKPSTAVNAEIRTNTRLRISLQVEDKQDSLDVIGRPDAAAIAQKGRGYVRVGQGEVIAIQSALASGTTGTARALVDAGPFRFGRDPVGEATGQVEASAGAGDRRTGAGPCRAPGPRTADPAADRVDDGPVDDGRVDDGPVDDGGLAAGPVAGSAGGGVTPEAPNDLERLVAALGEAFSASGSPPPRRPWPDPLPDVVALAELAAVADTSAPGSTRGAARRRVDFLLADDPAAQVRYPLGWEPSDGDLLIYGVVGSGTTTALGSLAMAFAEARSAEEGHLYVLDFGAGALAPLTALPHCGAVVTATERERQIRLIRHLRGELDRRRKLPPAEQGAEPEVLLLIDNIEAFRAEFDAAGGLGVFDDTVRLFADGPQAGIYVAATAARVGGVPASVASAVPQKLVLRLPDVADYGAFGVGRRQVPTFVPGRGVLAGSGRVVQVAWPGPDLAAAVAELAAAAPAPRRPPAAIASLPTEVDAAGLLGLAAVDAERWLLPVGLADRDLAPASLTLYAHEHAVIAGPPRSGKSSTLLLLAAGLRRAVPSATVVGVAARRSPVRDSALLDRVVTDPAELAPVLEELTATAGPALLLIDDAEGLDDDGGRLEQLLGARLPELHVAIAGRADVLRTRFGHWTQSVRRSKAGVLLQPSLDYDGELLGTALPRRVHTQLSRARGFLVSDGETELVQVAQLAP